MVNIFFNYLRDILFKYRGRNIIYVVGYDNLAIRKWMEFYLLNKVYSKCIQDFLSK